MANAAAPRLRTLRWSTPGRRSLLAPCVSLTIRPWSTRDSYDLVRQSVPLLCLVIGKVCRLLTAT